jgi:pyrroline-5-carboxylate reductase
MKSRLNVGVIGLGRLGRVYAEDLARYVSNASLVAVADNRADVAARFAQEYGVPKWYEGQRDLLHNEEVAAVAVITPTSTHKEVCQPPPDAPSSPTRVGVLSVLAPLRQCQMRVRSPCPCRPETETCTPGIAQLIQATSCSISDPMPILAVTSHFLSVRLKNVTWFVRFSKVRPTIHNPPGLRLWKAAFAPSTNRWVGK